MASLILWGFFVFTQTGRHRDFFLPVTSDGTVVAEEEHADPPTTRDALISLALLTMIDLFGVGQVLWLYGVFNVAAFVFVFQFYVFYVFIPTWLPLHLALSPVIFLGAMLVIGGAARIWLHRRWRFSRTSWFGDAAPGLPGAKR